MVEKLKLILSQTRWSLLTKALIFGVSWALSPFWLFAGIAVFLYCFPWFSTRKFIFPFACILLVAGLSPISLWVAVVLAAAFYLLIGIKELFFINRASAYHVLILILLFLATVQFFSYFDNGMRLLAVGALFICSALFFLLARDMRHRDQPDSSALAVSEARFNLSFALGTILSLQVAVAVLALPLHFLYQTALLFLSMAVILELITYYLYGRLNRVRVVALLCVVFAIFVFVLTTASWEL